MSHYIHPARANFEFQNLQRIRRLIATEAPGVDFEGLELQNGVLCVQTKPSNQEPLGAWFAVAKTKPINQLPKDIKFL